VKRRFREALAGSASLDCVARSQRTHVLRRLGWLAVLATGIALYVASLQGVGAVRGELEAATSQGPPPDVVPVAYRDDRPTGWGDERPGCRDRGGSGGDHRFPSPRDF
jgi:hypothetical protein